MKPVFSLLLSAITLSMLGLCCAAPAQKPVRSKATPKAFRWSNPIYIQGNGPQDTIRDPAIIKDDGIYYIVYTMWPFRNYTDRDSPGAFVLTLEKPINAPDGSLAADPARCGRG